ncbi:hypothetical protein QNM99_28965 [Pseudomonas sp. PCH446]
MKASVASSSTPPICSTKAPSPLEPSPAAPARCPARRRHATAGKPAMARCRTARATADDLQPATSHPGRTAAAFAQRVFEARAALTPHAVALVCAGQSLDYAELNARPTVSLIV